MMEALIARAGSIACAAQRKRIEQIAESLRDRGLAVELSAQSAIIRGRRLAQKWLGDPFLRFAGRCGQ